MKHFNFNLYLTLVERFTRNLRLRCKEGDRALKWYTAHCSLFTHEILIYAIYKIRRPRLMQGGPHQGLQFTGFRLYNNNYYYYYNYNY